jgi:hypothetical protein
MLDRVVWCPIGKSKAVGLHMSLAKLKLQLQRSPPHHHLTYRIMNYTVRSESRCPLMLRYVDLVVIIEVAVEMCCFFTVFIR